MVKKKISESTIRRLSLYLRALSMLEKEGYDTVSSKDSDNFSEQWDRQIVEVESVLAVAVDRF